jgi:large subunit ribosomal protein L21
MYAIIETGGKQYRVAAGDIIEIERVSKQEGDRVEFSRVLLVGGDGSTRTGNPVIDGARVRGVAVGETRGPKIRVFKRKKRKGYRRTTGHRQDLMRVRIEGIE